MCVEKNKNELFCCLVVLTDFNETKSAACLWYQSDRNCVSSDIQPSACPAKSDIKSRYTRSFLCDTNHRTKRHILNNVYWLSTDYYARAL